MRKLILAIIAVTLLFLAMPLAAQKKSGFTAGLEFMMIGDFESGRGYLPWDLQVGGGYAFNDIFSLKLVLNSMTEFNTTGGMRDFYWNPGLSLRGDFKLLDFKSGFNDLGLFVTGGSTLDSPRYNYFYGDAGVKIRRKFDNRTRFYISAGVRYSHPYKKEHDSLFGIFIGVGFELGR